MIRKESVYMKDMYFTITGCNHYLGNEFMEKGMKVKLKKEPDNEFDTEAIMVQIKGIGKCGYVANSPFTVKGESLSAGRLYDRIGKTAKGKIIYEQKAANQNYQRSYYFIVPKALISVSPPRSSYVVHIR